MDFMREERDRGITIQSACITFAWTRITAESLAAAAAGGGDSSSKSRKGSSSAAAASASAEYRINLIDTPGHVDFTQQVEQSLRVLDGAIVVLDGVKGVEAQTLTVWNQAAQYGVARVAFVNKLDRDGASFEAVVESVRDKLHTVPLVLTLPIYDTDSAVPKLQGIVDLLCMEQWVWGGESSGASGGGSPADTGATFAISALPVGHPLYNQAARMREQLLESLAEVDEETMDIYLATEEPAKKNAAMHVSAEQLRNALRRLTTRQLQPTARPGTTAAAPSSSPSSSSSSSPAAAAAAGAAPSQTHTLVVCGSSKANKGVQFLLNSIVDYLPSPLDKKFIELEPIGATATPSSSSSASTTPPPTTGKGKKSASSASSSSSSSASASAVPVSSSFQKLVGACDPSKEPLVALAFKVSHDLSRGALPIVFVRVYSGLLRKGDSVVSVSPPESAAQISGINKSLNSTTANATASSANVAAAASSSPSSSSSPLSSLPRERPQKLLEISADNLSLELGCIEAGNIGALVGLKHTRTGDTILSATSAAASASSASVAQQAKWDASSSSKNGGGVDSRVGYLRGITFSEPVFFCSVEAASVSAQALLEQALGCLVREDPSVVVSLDPESGQTLIKGMGELHLDIIRSRLQHDFQLGGTPQGSSGHMEGGVEFGKMRISYREGVGSALSLEGFRYTAGALASGGALSLSDADAVASFEVEPLEAGGGVVVEVRPEGTTLASAPHAPSSVALRAALEAGVRDALARGPLLGYALTDVLVRVSALTLATNTTSTASLANSLRGCAARGVATLLRQAREDRNVHLLEPVMSASVALASSSLGDVLSDLTSKRRAHIIDVGQLSSGQNARSYIHAEVPLSSMLGYASALRSTTQGNGSFSMQFLQFRTMPTHLQTALIESPP